MSHGKSKYALFEKSAAKTFGNFMRGVEYTPGPESKKVFWLLFFKKVTASFLIPTSTA
jgi:hypothetical protein